MKVLNEIYSILNTFALSIGFNFLDLILIAVFIFYAIEGYTVGFIASFLDLIGFTLSFILALKFYSLIGKLLIEGFSMPQGFANAIGFFVVAFLSETIFAIISRIFLRKIPTDVASNKINRVFGFIPGVFSAAVLLAFILTLIVSLPLSAPLKKSVSESKIGNLLISETSGLEKRVNNVFGEAINDTLNFLTIEPKSDEFVKLNFKSSNLSVSEEQEEKMLAMINQERISRGINPLVMERKLREVARLHSKDMFEEGYFSHISPDGLSPFDRMTKKEIDFNFAGENLALSPNVEIAMKGLMESPGHKENILSSDFNKVGIGAMDGGIYGVMFSQEFTD